MKFSLKIISIAAITAMISCVSTKSTIRNIDNNAPDLVLLKNNTFQITEYSTDPKYGYNKDYPVNIFYKDIKNDSINQMRFLNALAGPNGETLRFRKLESCCPYPTKRNELGGVGMLDVYEIDWEGPHKPLKIYINMYDKGYVKVPVGLTLKKQ
ncbi:MAG: 2-dehydro-3-deoxyphosphooctonate aldolase [Flavobacterium sp. BFFFF1]|uniref:2-dehydro-3-deoxyphosphooctonate aldolase n=1 Tax=unclassified Flavobacterium TaxID=196869 RepID=UPI000BD5C74E|nr:MULTISPECIES: 2-dehydro-3-deoxyphosphooctonate aldolase [unclassified Flavobacterium]OYU79437.1 MAG: 2-dehydro-3-deoxyphosphooctonate aldolase [Flavobacterium sp. BFFFF1]